MERPAAAAGAPSVSKAVGATAATAGKPPVAKKVPNPDGSPGKPDHQATVKRLEGVARREFPDKGRYEIRVNQSIRQETGINRRPDVSVFDRVKERIVKVYEAARANQDGVTPVARERKKVLEYEGRSIPVQVEIVK